VDENGPAGYRVSVGFYRVVYLFVKSCPEENSTSSLGNLAHQSPTHLASGLTSWQLVFIKLDNYLCEQTVFIAKRIICRKTIDYLQSGVQCQNLKSESLSLQVK